MSDLVPAEEIENIVGARRHATVHVARAVSAEETVYVLHSAECRDSGRDLRLCPYSEALDVGIDGYDWLDLEDQAVAVTISEFDGRLVPDEVTEIVLTPSRKDRSA